MEDHRDGLEPRCCYLGSVSVFSAGKTLYTCELFAGPVRLACPNFGSSFMDLFIEFASQQWILVGALVVAVALFFNHETRKSGHSLSPQQAINRVNADDGVFVDLRDAGDYGTGHIVDALSIPASKLDARLAELEKYREKPIVLVCKMGQHSGAAGKKLNAQGFSEVYRMTGGMMEWGNLQLPLVK
jgi:rhodanese-related sulfurtransferase